MDEGMPGVLAIIKIIRLVYGLGNFSGVGVADLSGANIATPLLFKIFNTIDYDSDEEWFSQPDDCDIRQVCSETGLAPSDHCH